MRQSQQNYKLWFYPVLCVSVHIRGSPNVYFFLCDIYFMFYVLLTTNQNTKNMLFSLFTNFFQEKIWIKNTKKRLVQTKSKFGQQQSNLSKLRVFQDFFGWSSLKRLQGSCVYFHAFFDKSKIKPEPKNAKKPSFFKNQLRKPVSHILEIGFLCEILPKMSNFQHFVLCASFKNIPILPIN